MGWSGGCGDDGGVLYCSGLSFISWSLSGCGGRPGGGSTLALLLSVVVLSLGLDGAELSVL